MKSNAYKLTVGIECHVQLKTKSKLFSGADNNDKNSPPNTLINHIDFGLPGALPVLNQKAIELASKAAFALNSKPQPFSKFDRKHYFYPDLPMGYQISQYDQPIISGGHVEFVVGGKLKKVNITRAHLEADAGKSLHPEKQNYSLVDLNRAGTPLLEIVSEPEMHSPEEARVYARELYLLMRYAEVSEANLYYGNMRFDINVSVSKNSQLGTRTETKNLNSFRSVERVVAYEMTRQIELLESGQKVTQETRGWNEAKNQGYLMRSKENADDYRYMPDPDLPPVVLEDKYIESIKAAMPKLPSFWRQELTKRQLDESISESLIEAEIEFEAANLELLTKLDPQAAKTIANWIVNIELPLRRQQKEKNQSLGLNDAERHLLYEVVRQMQSEGSISATNVKLLISRLLITDNLPEDIKVYSEESGLLQSSDKDALSQLIDEAIKANPQTVKDIEEGKQQAIGFLVGQVMKGSKGQANPTLVSRQLLTKLKKVKDGD